VAVLRQRDGWPRDWWLIQCDGWPRQRDGWLRQRDVCHSEMDGRGREISGCAKAERRVAEVQR
jgi:hypothetical protein